MTAGFIQIILSAVLFGTMPFFTKQLYAMGGNPLTVCVERFAFSIPFLYLLARRGGSHVFSVTAEQFKKLLVLAVSLGFTPVLLFASYQYIPSGMATTLNFVYPIAVVLGCVLFYREKLTVRKAVCCLLCTGGILSFYAPEAGGNLMGVLLAFFSGITYAVYIVYYAKSGLAELGPYKVSFYISLLSALMLGALGIVSGGLVAYEEPMGWAVALWLSFMISVLATVLFQFGTKRIGAENAALLSTFEPLTGVFLGITVFKEPLTLRTMAGVILILSAVVILTVGEKGQEREAG